MTSPKWINPQRQAYLAELVARSSGFCVFGHKPCKGHWETETQAVCYWGKACYKPVNPDNKTSVPPLLCNHRREDDKPALPCEVVHKVQHLWHCDYKDHACYKPFECHYVQVETQLIKSWVNDDRQERLAIQKVEDIANHRTNDRTYPLHGKYSGVSQDIYYSNQLDFFVEGYGISGLTFKPFVKLRIASTQVRLYVELDQVLKPLSKNARRKAIRYKHINTGIQNSIDLACIEAVRNFKR